MEIERRLEQLGLQLPQPAKRPADVVVRFAWVRVLGERALISGHGPQLADGSLAGPFGRVGAEVTPEQAPQSARLATLAILGSLKRAIGDLDRIAAWLRVEGFILAAPGFDRTTNVLNGCSDLLLDLLGRRSASTRASRWGSPRRR